jgi:quercetin dioxygenase-like cupin family protein
MSSLKRPVTGDVLFHHLKRDELTLDTALLEAHGRTARTLVKEGPLRLTLMALAKDGVLPEHRADGPVSIHVLQGDVVFTALGQEYPMKSGEVLVFAVGVPHAARSAGGCVFLLTVVHTEHDPTPVG